MWKVFETDRQSRIMRTISITRSCVPVLVSDATWGSQVLGNVPYIQNSQAHAHCIPPRYAPTLRQTDPEPRTRVPGLAAEIQQPQHSRAC